MNTAQVKQNIQSRSFSPVYIFTGEEIGIMNIYINQIAKVKRWNVARLDTFKEVFGKLRAVSLLEKSDVYVVRDDIEVLENSKIWEWLESPIWADKAIVILVFTTIDKRKAFYKKFKDRICEFEPLDDVVLSRYIKNEIKLNDRNCKKLIEVCEHSYSRIMLEIDKIKQYAYGIAINKEDISYDYYFNALLKNGIIYQPAQDSIFLWSDTIMSRNRAEAFRLTDVCFRSGEAVLTMLSVLYGNIKKVLQVKGCESNEIGKETGLSGWEIQNAKKFTNNFSIGELLDAIHCIREMETGIKTGKIEETAAIPYVLVNML